MPTRRQLRRQAESRYGLTDYAEWKHLAGASFPTYGGSWGGGGSGQAEQPDGTFDGYAGIYKSNGIVAACMNVRLSLFGEIRFRHAEFKDGRIGKRVPSDLSILERPWPNGTTGELAGRMIQDVDLAGNFYATRSGDRLVRLNPGKTSIILTGDPNEDAPEDIEVLGYAYQPKGMAGKTYTYLPGEVCHWSPLPDPQHSYRGMSWLTPILREIAADNAATDHKSRFFANGATPNLVVKFPENVMSEEAFARFKTKMDAEHRGAGNAYKTLYLAPGADVIPVGVDMSQLDFNSTQGRDEARIAAAAGMPAVIVGIKESLQGSSLNTGNYSAARRRLADGTMRPLYRSGASALETLAPAPGGAVLTYDDSHVAFFREDRADAAAILKERLLAVESAVRAGFKPGSAVHAVEEDDLTLLEHTGLYSVQLQPPGTDDPTKEPAA